MLVAEVELHPGAAGHHVAPQRILAAVGPAGARVARRAQRVLGIARFVAGHHPGLAGGRRVAAPSPACPERRCVKSAWFVCSDSPVSLDAVPSSGV